MLLLFLNACLVLLYCTSKYTSNQHNILWSQFQLQFHIFLSPYQQQEQQKKLFFPTNTTYKRFHSLKKIHVNMICDFASAFIFNVLLLFRPCSHEKMAAFEWPWRHQFKPKRLLESQHVCSWNRRWATCKFRCAFFFLPIHLRLDTSF